MFPSPVPHARPRARFGWLAGVLTFVLLALFGVLLAPPATTAVLPATAASAFVPADATRGRVTLRVGAAEVPADLTDARLAAPSVGSAVSPTAYEAVDPAVRAGRGSVWFRESVVPTDGELAGRLRVRIVDGRGIWLVVQDWGDLGLALDGLLELPADVAAGHTWTSEGTARARPTDGELHFSSSSAASTPTDPVRATEGCLTVGSRTELTGARRETWRETELWCPGKGVVASSGTRGSTTYAVTSGGAANPVSDADLASSPWDPSGVAGWQLRPRTVVGGDPTFGFVDASTTALLEAGGSPVVTASGLVVFPTLEGGDLAGLVARGPDLWAHWWARPGGQITSTAVEGSLVVVPTTAHRVSAYRAGRTLAWNAPLDDVAVAPPLPVGDAFAVATVGGTLTLLDARTGVARWTTAVGAGVHDVLAAGDGVVVTADTRSTVTAWGLADGRRRWQVDGAANPFSTTLVVAGDQVVVAAGGTVSAYAAADGRRTWVRQGGLGLGTTTLVGDALWLGVGDDLQAWSVVDGTRRWTLAGAQPLTTAASGCVAAAGPTLGLARQGDRLVAVAGDGSLRGSWPLPVARDDVVVATCRGAGVDLVEYGRNGSRPLTVLRLSA